MIWFLTPHWKVDRWMKIQHDRITLLEGAARNFGVLATVPPYVPTKDYYTGHWVHEPEFNLNGKSFPNHWLKLDFLFMKCLELGAKEDHVVIFLDGDAFPIGEDFRARIHRALELRKFVFIQEDAEVKPHCGFFACKVRDWRGMSWCPGPWSMLGPDRQPVKEEFDIGGPLASLCDPGLSHILERTSNPHHEEFFATWGDKAGPLVYHHGAGFRKSVVSRAERARNVDGRRTHAKNARLSEELFQRLKKGENLW